FISGTGGGAQGGDAFCNQATQDLLEWEASGISSIGLCLGLSESGLQLFHVGFALEPCFHLADDGFLFGSKSGEIWIFIAAGSGFTCVYSDRAVFAREIFASDALN